MYELDGFVVGLDELFIDIVWYWKSIMGVGDLEVIIMEVGCEFFMMCRFDLDIYVSVLVRLGKINLVDFIDLMGCYVLIVVMLIVFN